MPEKTEVFAMISRFLWIATALMVALSSPLRAGEIALSSLRINDGGTIKPYTDVVTLPKPQWWAKGLPLAFSSISKASFLNTEQWLRSYDFDHDGWLTKAELTQAWLVQSAEWATGRKFAPADLMAANNQPLRGVEISIAEERSVRAAINAVGGDAGQAAMRNILYALKPTFYEGGYGGDDGGGASSDRGNDNAKDE